MTQVGISVDGAWFHEKLAQLHYGRKPGTELGPESAGLLYKLPWDKRNDQASVSFGHQIEVTLWQHAAALAAVLRGGRWRPLRLLDSVSQEGAGRPLPPAPFDPARDQVFSAATSRELRAMMELGARAGTGRPVCAKRDDLRLASKTGTAQKLALEMCQHAYGQAIDRAAQSGRGLTKAEYQALRTRGPAHGGSCYTSSMCLLGSRAGVEREVLVLVVVDEPTKGGHFGSSVAGPCALAILDEALGVTRGGQPALAAIASEFSPDCELSAETPWEQPWREALR
jgi:cell division protein FtsI/penicillin-binding protein 2